MLRHLPFAMYGFIFPLRVRWRTRRTHERSAPCPVTARNGDLHRSHPGGRVDRPEASAQAPRGAAREEPGRAVRVAARGVVVRPKPARAAGGVQARPTGAPAGLDRARQPRGPATHGPFRHLPGGAARTRTTFRLPPESPTCGSTRALLSSNGPAGAPAVVAPARSPCVHRISLSSSARSGRARWSRCSPTARRPTLPNGIRRLDESSLRW